MNSKQAGFTLIELVMVIVILGILAATAAPKFLDLQADARRAAVDGMAGALKSAGAITYTACLLNTACNQNAATATASVSGTNVDVVYGWPAATATGIDVAADITLGNFTVAGTGPRVYTLTTNCTVTYTAATAPGASAAVTTDKTGC